MREILGILSTMVFYLPIFIIIYYKLYTHISFIAVMIYYFNSGTYSLMTEGIIQVPESVMNNFGAFCNYSDTILVLFILLLFCIDKLNSVVILSTIGLYTIYQFVIFYLYGTQPGSDIYATGPGIVMILLFTAYLFYKHIKFAIINNRGVGKSLMITAILFAYFCYAFVYWEYYILETPFVADVFIIYFISSIISTTLMVTGLAFFSKRYKQLRELRITRRELAMFFNDASVKKDMRFFG